MRNLFQKEGNNGHLSFKTSIEKETYDDGEVKFKVNTDEWNNDVSSNYLANTEIVLTIEDFIALKEIFENEIEIADSPNNIK